MNKKKPNSKMTAKDCQKDIIEELLKMGVVLKILFKKP